MSPVRKLIVISMLAAVTSGCAPSSALSPSPSPLAIGTIAGDLLVTDRDHPSGRPMASVSLGLYLQAFSTIGNPYTSTPPQAFAVAMTAKDGSFVFSGIAPGRYFLALKDASLYMPGQWVEVSAAAGTRVTLVVCGTCPPPN